jgi:metal-responsive CopG/Arc/MetJ family transcriptional regulator
MRTTINLPADLQNAVASIAAHSRKSMNQTVADLIRRALAQPATRVDAEAKTLVRVDKATGLPTVRSPRPVSVEDVKALEDD